MNYFELFEIPVQLQVDKTRLSPKFFELSRKYHPDFFVNSSENEKAHALERSAMLNKGYKTFQDTGATIKYVLQLKNLLQEEEKYELPAGFLMEVMEINEQLMDEPADPAVKIKLRSAIDDLQAAIYKPVKGIIEGYEEGITSEKELLQVKEYYYKKKYLDRIHKQLIA